MAEFYWQYRGPGYRQGWTEPDYGWVVIGDWSRVWFYFLYGSEYNEI